MWFSLWGCSRSSRLPFESPTFFPFHTFCSEAAAGGSLLRSLNPPSHSAGHEQGAWRWPLGSAAGALVSCCAPPPPSRSAGKLGLCRVQKALDPHRKAEGSNTGSATSLCGLENMHLALMNHSFLLCKMRAAVKIDEIRCMFLAQGLLHRGCPSSIAWIWIWYWHCWLNTWTMSIAFRPGLCTFVKLLHWSGFPWLMFPGTCNRSPIKQ